MEFNERETAHILAALRFAQQPENDISGMDHFAEGQKPLSGAEVDELAERLNCEPEPSTQFTVLGLWPDADLRPEHLQEASFVEQVTADNPSAAAQAARLQAARRRVVFASEDDKESFEAEAAEFAVEISILACFPGHLMDQYSPKDAE